jgi:hypothetical protein
MHEMCEGPDWYYKPETYIKHTVWQWESPVAKMLKDFNIELPKQDVFFSQCFF